MPQPPKTAITQDIRHKVARLDRLSREEKHYLRARLRGLVEQHFDDLDWFFGDLNLALDRSRKDYRFVFEVPILHDPKYILEAIRKMEGWKENIDKSIAALEMLHGAAFRRL